MSTRQPSRATARRAILLLMLCAALGASCSPSEPAGSPTQPSPPAASPVRVLMLTATAGFRHESIPAARQVMAALGPANGFTVTATEDLSVLNTSTLAAYDVLLFALTSGELALAAEQKAAILAFVAGGRGFVGAHSAADTLHGWPEYRGLLGASFKEHPWTSPGRIAVEDRAHPTTAGLGEAFEVTEEFYTFTENPRPRVHVLLRLDAASVAASGDYPLAWTLAYGSGRVYYNALGHFEASWRDSRFHRQLAAAIVWVAQR